MMLSSSDGQLRRRVDINSSSSHDSLRRLEKSAARQTKLNSSSKRNRAKKQRSKSLKPSRRPSLLDSQEDEMSHSARCVNISKGYMQLRKAQDTLENYGMASPLFDLINDAKQKRKEADCILDDASLISMNTGIDDDEPEQDHSRRGSPARRRGRSPLSTAKAARNKSPKRSESGKIKPKPSRRPRSNNKTSKSSRSVSPKRIAKPTAKEDKPKQRSSRSLSPVMMRKGTREEPTYQWDQHKAPKQPQSRPKLTDLDDSLSRSESSICSLRIGGQDASSVFKQCSTVGKRGVSPHRRGRRGSVATASDRRRSTRASIRCNQADLPPLIASSATGQPINPWIQQLDDDDEEEEVLIPEPEKGRDRSSRPSLAGGVIIKKSGNRQPLLVDEETESKLRQLTMQRDASKRSVRASDCLSKFTPSGIQPGTYRNMIGSQS